MFKWKYFLITHLPVYIMVNKVKFSGNKRFMDSRANGLRFLFVFFFTSTCILFQNDMHGLVYLVMVTLFYRWRNWSLEISVLNQVHTEWKQQSHNPISIWLQKLCVWTLPYMSFCKSAFTFLEFRNLWLSTLSEDSAFSKFFEV